MIVNTIGTFFGNWLNIALRFIVDVLLAMYAVFKFLVPTWFQKPLLIIIFFTLSSDFLETFGWLEVVNDILLVIRMFQAKLFSWMLG